jgi:hypothetical protein
MVLWRVPDPDGGDGAHQFVDLQRDATVADIARGGGCRDANGRAHQAVHDDRHCA